MALDATITLAEVIHKMDSGERFDIEVVTADVNRGTGGELKTWPNCIKHMNERRGSGKIGGGPKGGNPKKPYHYENSTRNIWLLGKREVRKIHLRLITRFNGKRVL